MKYMKKTKIVLSGIIFLGMLLYLPSVVTPAHAATSTVCLVVPGSTTCPTSPTPLTGAPGAQLRVAVFLQGSNLINGFDVATLADHTVLKPAGIDLTGSILPAPPTILAECLSGILLSGSQCLTTDTIDTIHLAAVAPPGMFATSTTGLLFTAIYNITSTTSGIPVGFQTGCSNTSVPPNTCVTLANGTPTAIPAIVQTATFSTSTAPDFAMSSNPNSITLVAGSTATSSISIVSINGFAGTVSLSAKIVPSGPGTSLSSTSLALGSGQTLSSILTVSTTTSTTTGSYVVTVNGTSGSFAHFTAVSLTVNPPPQPDFTMSSNPASLTIQAGSRASSTVTLTSINSFSGTVSLATSVTNTGIVATLSMTSISLSASGSGTSVLTISTTTATQPGSYAATVTGTSATLSHITGVTITVTSGSTPDFTISASPSSLTLGADATGTSTISVTAINGFSGTASLTVTSSSGLIATISPTSVSIPGTATLTVRSSSPGSYSALVTATSGGFSHNFTVSVTILQVGEVCVVTLGSTACPSGILSFSGTSGTQLRVSVFIQATSPMNGFDITLLADHTIFVPTGINLTGSIIGSSSSPPTVLVECLQGVLVSGSVCSTTDTINTLHLAAVSAPGFPLTSPGSSGLLFTATYNIVTTTSGTIISFQTGCTNTSVSGGVCVTIANGTPTPVPQTVPMGSPSFTMTAVPNNLTISRGSQGSSTITLTSIGGFTGTVTLSSSVSPNNRHGPSITLSASTITLSSGGTGTTTLTISTSKNTPTGTYTITLTGTSGSTSVPVTITVTITR